MADKIFYASQFAWIMGLWLDPSGSDSWTGTTKPSSTYVHLVILLCKLLSEDLLDNALTRSDSIYHGSNAQNLKLELHDSRARVKAIKVCCD